MEEAERHTKHVAQTEELYAAIGRFTVKFEHVCQAMQTVVAQLLQLNGLQHAGLANAVLSGLTADPMLAIFRASIVEVRKDALDAEEAKILKNVVTRIRKLIETRNDIIHRTWFVGWAAPTDEEFSSVTGWKFKNTGSGAEFRPLQFTKDDFNNRSMEADELTLIVNRMMGCLLLGRPFAPNFQIDADGGVHSPPNTSSGFGL